MSPLAAEATSSIITITPTALVELAALRDTEPDAERPGLRLEIISKPGEDFKYDLSFDVVTKAAFTDEVRTHTAEGVTLIHFWATLSTTIINAIENGMLVEE